MKVLSRLPVLDEYADADRCAVMLGNDVLVLSEIPTALLRALSDSSVSASAPWVVTVDDCTSSPAIGVCRLRVLSGAL